MELIRHSGKLNIRQTIASMQEGETLALEASTNIGYVRNVCSLFGKQTGRIYKVSGSHEGPTIKRVK